MAAPQAEKYDVEALLLEGTPVQFAPTGWSMYPLIVNGRDQVVVEPVDPARVGRGDVVLYRRPGDILVLHRVWKRAGEGLYLVGDNQVEVEGPLSPGQVRGVMTAVIRKGKRISVEDPGYRFLTGLWLLLRPIRMGLARPAAAVKRAFRRLFSR